MLPGYHSSRKALFGQPRNCIAEHGIIRETAPASDKEVDRGIFSLLFRWDELVCRTPRGSARDVTEMGRKQYLLRRVKCQPGTSLSRRFAVLQCSRRKARNSLRSRTGCGPEKAL